MKLDDNWKSIKVGDLVSCLSSGAALRTGIIVENPSPYKQEFGVLFANGDKKKVLAEYVKKVS
jgi:hypothetical protein